MNKSQINAQIRKDKAAIKQAANRANRILSKYPELQRDFVVIMEKAREQKQLGSTPWFNMPVESFSGVGSYGYQPPVAGLGEERGRWGYGVPGSGAALFAENTPRAFTGLGQNNEGGGWFDTFLESDFTSDLLDFGQKIVTHERIAKDEQRQLELEIQQIQAKTAELEKQTALAEALERSGTMTRAVGTTLRENPMTIPLLVGLGALLFFQVQKRR